jgi:hypothetical protein
MNYKITNTDYINILKFYNVSIPKNSSQLKKAAEDILALKLCSCIKKVNPELTKKKEPRAIGICSRSILKKKGLSRGNFKCLKNRSITIKKTQKHLRIRKSKTMKKK